MDTNPFASYPFAGILADMDVEVIHGSCLHGHPVQSLVDAVYFVEPCPVCPAVLRAEGYWVVSFAAA